MMSLTTTSWSEATTPHPDDLDRRSPESNIPRLRKRKKTCLVRLIVRHAICHVLLDSVWVWYMSIGSTVMWIPISISFGIFRGSGMGSLSEGASHYEGSWKVLPELEVPKNPKNAHDDCWMMKSGGLQPPTLTAKRVCFHPKTCAPQSERSNCRGMQHEK